MKSKQKTNKSGLRKSSSHLIISSVHLGYDEDILDVFANVAGYFKSKVYHIGPTVTEKEAKDYLRFSKELANVNQQLNEIEPETKRYYSLEEKLSALDSECEDLISKEQDRIGALMDTFKGITFVTNNHMTLGEIPAPRRHDGELALGKYLTLRPVMPSSVKNITKPVNRNASNVMKAGKSWVIPHPVPTTNSAPRPGLNESRNYFSVGALRRAEVMPERTQEQFQVAHMPAAVFVVIDEENGEFHANHMYVDFDTKTKKPIILFDGWIFTATSVFQAKSSDKAAMWTDAHTPHQHPGVLGCMIKINAMHEPETFIDGGDSADFESVSRHTRDKPGLRENLRVINDLNSLKLMLTKATDVPSIKKRVLIDSNHHEWLTGFVEGNPALIGILDWKTVAKQYLPAWDVTIRDAGENQVYQFGDLTIRHGDKDGGAKRAETIFENGKYICGHFHTLSTYRRAAQMGCAAKLGPKYTGNQVNAWQNQVATITRHLGVTSYAIKSVLHDKTQQKSRVMYLGQIFEVPHEFLELLS